MGISKSYCCLSLIAIMFCSSQALGQINVIGWGLLVRAVDDLGGGPDQEDEANVLFPPNPFSYHETSMVQDGASSSTAVYDFQANGNLASFEFDFDHVRAGSPRSLAHGVGNLTLSTTQEVAYDIAGMYTSTGGGEVRLFVSITDQTTDELIFDSGQYSTSTQDEEFTVGLQEGDAFNSLIGSTSGILPAGHDFLIHYLYDIRIPREAPSADGGASATGFLNFTITPEPTSAMLLGLGGLTLLRRTRRTRFPLDAKASSVTF